MSSVAPADFVVASASFYGFVFFDCRHDVIVLLHPVNDSFGAKDFFVDILGVNVQGLCCHGSYRDTVRRVVTTIGSDQLSVGFYRRSRPSASGLDPEGEGRKLG